MMANQEKSTDVVSLHEALQMEIVINQALTDLLIEKGVLSKEELLAKIEEVRREMFDRRRSKNDQIC